MIDWIIYSFTCVGILGVLELDKKLSFSSLLVLLASFVILLDHYSVENSSLLEFKWFLTGIIVVVLSINFYSILMSREKN